MGLRVNTNMASIGAQRALLKNSENQSKTYKRIASGERITSAADDAAGLAISEKMKSSIRSMNQANRNANDGISLVQVAEGGLSELANILVRLRELNIQAASDTVGDRERTFIDKEVQSLKSEVDRIANVTSFNEVPLLNAKAEKSELEFQVGIFDTESDRITFNASDYDVQTSALGIDGIDSLSVDSARGALNQIDDALGIVNERRAGLGAIQNKLHATTNNLSIASENLSNARSRIADADLAVESSKLVKDNILQSAGVSILSQANTAPTLALKLV